MKNIIENFNKSQIEKLKTISEISIPKFKSGDTVSVKYKITEGETTRIQAFNGVIIAKSKSLNNYNATFTVRKISSNVGVERMFNLYSPLLSSIEIIKEGDVRRAKLYYLRELRGKASRIKDKLNFQEENIKNSD